MGEFTLGPNRAYPNIPTIGDDLESHTAALNQIVEALNIHQRRVRTGLGDSFVRISELESLGLVEITNNLVVATTSSESGGGLTDIVDDTTPQLGGTLDANGQTIDMGANTITDTKVGQWDSAYSWGNHASAGYSTSTPVWATGQGRSSGFDIDTAITDGVYKMSSPGNHNATPGSLGYGTLMVVDNSDVHSQLYLARDDDGRAYVRCKATTDFAGGGWNRLWSDADFDFASNMPEDIDLPYGFHGGYSDAATTTFGATIWSLDTSYNGGAAAANSVSTSVYGIRWIRSTHTDAHPSVGEGLYGFINGTRYWALGPYGALAQQYVVGDANTILDKGSADSFKLITDDGYVEIGPQSASYNHFITDRAKHYMNKPLDVAGQILYYTKGAYPYYDSSSYASGKITVSSTAPSSPSQGDIWFDIS